MNFFALPETRAATAAPPAARGYTPKAPTDDFALMLAESAAALRPEKPAQYKDAPREPDAAEEADATPAAQEDRPPAAPDAPPEVDDDADGNPGEDASADTATAQSAPTVGEAARAAIAAAAAAAASSAANAAVTPAATGPVDTAAAEGAAQAVTVVASAVALITDASATDAALKQMTSPQTGSAAPAKPAATPASAPVSADTPAVELAASLLAAAPEPAVPGNATDAPAPATRPTPGLIATPQVDPKSAPATAPKVQSSAPAPVQADATPPQQAPAALALAPAAAQETAAPGTGMIQAAIAAAIRDAAPDSPAPVVSSAAADAPAVVPQAAQGHAPAAPAERAAALPPAPAPTAPTLDNITQYTVRSVRLMMHDGQQTLTVRLIPESLGELHLEVSSLRDSLHVRLMSANPVVRDALERQLGSLRDTLARSGVEAASVTVSSGSTAGQASHNPLAGGRNDGPAAHLDPQPASGQNPADGHQSSRRSTAHQGLIDVFI